MIRRPQLAALVLASLALAACGRTQEGFHLLPLVVDKIYAVSADEIPDGLSFPRAPEVRTLEIDHEERPVVLTSTAPWRWRGRTWASW